MTINTRQSLVVLIVGALSVLGASAQSLPNLYPFPNAAGLLETYNAGGKAIDLTGPFFQSLGTNGRSCGSCHRPAQGWAISADEVKHRFQMTQGRIRFSEPTTVPTATITSTRLQSVVAAKPTAF